jgi:predicted ATP-dependent endonuclease of OLD family
MEIELKNIGLLRHANVQINGLTIIAGENDTGKSTVGKTIFAIIKAFTRYSEDFAQDNKKNIFKKLDNVYFRLRRSSVLYNELREEFYPPKVFKELEYFLNIGDFEGLDLFLNKKIELVNSLEINERVKHDLVDRIINIRSAINYSSEQSDYIRNALNLALLSEFGSQISNKFSSEISTISCKENNNSILNVSLSQDKVINIDYIDELFYKEATYIESPLVLQMYDAISKSNAFFDDEEILSNTPSNIGVSRPRIVFHMKDLIAKMENAQYYKSYNADGDSVLSNKVSSIINGDVSFIKEQKDFVFFKNINSKQVPIKSNNLATGIKSFGILQLLLKAGLIHEQSLIIIDEPEIHLHPKWQVEYCRIIVELVKKDVSVIVTTHSPYVLQALKVFSEHAGLEDKTNYYLAEKELNTHTQCSSITDISNNLNKAFKILSEPLKNLVWES